MDTEVDIEELPDAVPRAEFKPVLSPGKPTLIAIDLETTDLSMICFLPFNLIYDFQKH